MGIDGGQCLAELGGRGWLVPRALGAKHKAPSRAMTRGSPNRKAGALLPSAVSVGSATRSKAGLARTPLCPTRSWRAEYRATRPKVERKLGHLMRRRHGGASSA